VSAVTDAFVWMRHPDIDDAARFAEAAADVWKARGWVECDPPTETDPTNTVLVDGVVELAEEPPGAASEDTAPVDDVQPAPPEPDAAGQPDTDLDAPAVDDTEKES
jgi:hypothetical protein